MYTGLQKYENYKFRTLEYINIIRYGLLFYSTSPFLGLCVT